MRATPNRPRLRLVLTAVPAVTVALAVAAPAAWAEDPVVTAQARIANAEFLAFAPPPAEGAGAVCLVDTGVDLNPDTEANVIERLALDGGDPGDVYHAKHGTEMAMVMGGPVNDWGSVGIWPHVRIVSVRAMPPGESSFPFNYYKAAVSECRRRSATRRILSVNLSLGGAGATQQEVQRLREMIVRAQQEGLNVVAAAGNAGAEVEYPAAVTEAFGVAAGEASGALCSFSARGAGVDVVAPGCGLNVSLADGRSATGGGTSVSSGLISAVLAALRSYRPDLGPGAAEELLVSSAQAAPDGPWLDVEAAFRAAGLGTVVDAGNAAAPTPPQPNRGGERPPDDRPSVGPGAQSLPKPRLQSVHLRSSRLTLRLANRPPGALVIVTVVYTAGRGEFPHRERTTEHASSIPRLRPPRRWSRVELEYRYFELEPSRRLVVTRRALRRQAQSNKRPRTEERGSPAGGLRR